MPWWPEVGAGAFSYNDGAHTAVAFQFNSDDDDDDDDDDDNDDDDDGDGDGGGGDGGDGGDALSYNIIYTTLLLSFIVNTNMPYNEKQSSLSLLFVFLWKSFQRDHICSDHRSWV